MQLVRIVEHEAGGRHVPENRQLKRRPFEQHLREQRGVQQDLLDHRNHDEWQECGQERRALGERRNEQEPSDEGRHPQRRRDHDDQGGQPVVEERRRLPDEVPGVGTAESDPDARDRQHH